MKKNKILKYLVIATIVLIVFSIVGKKAGWIGKKPSTEVITELATKRTIIETVSASGKVQPEIEVKISPDVSGEIVELYVKEGQEVKQGELLCKINPDIYLSNVDKMSAAVNTSKANLANSKARLAQVKAQFSNIESTYNRNKKLFDQGTISASEFESSKSAYEAAKADIEAAEQTVQASEFNVNNAQAAMKEATDNLSRTTIYSPVSGRISKLNIEKGERVVGTSQMAGTELMRIANLNEMEVNIDVNENDILRVENGDTSDIEIDAYVDRKFKGIVTEIANSANTSGVSADQVTNFQVKVRILRDSYKDLLDSLDPNASPFRPGMSATVDIRTKTVRDVLAVPIQAVTTRIDSSEILIEKRSDEKEEVKENKKNVDEIVFLHKDGVAYKQKVVTGVQDNNYIEILKGLNINDEVITGPYSAVSKTLKDSSNVLKVDKSELYKVKDDKN